MPGTCPVRWSVRDAYAGHLAQRCAWPVGLLCESRIHALPLTRVQLESTTIYALGVMVISDQTQLPLAGFADASVTFTTEAAPGMHAAIIRAVKPG